MINDILDYINLISSKKKPIVIHSSLWALSLLSGKSLNYINKKIFETLKFCAKKNTVLIPAFTEGFNKSKYINLDNSKIITGSLPEYIFKKNFFKRSSSAFFSFLYKGKLENRIENLQPKYAWGINSVFDWIYKNDCQMITLGNHPTNCSLTHYAEWLLRKKISYREEKAFSGTIELNKKKFFSKEILFVRKKKINNNFLKLYDPLKKGGLEVKSIKGFIVSNISAKKKIKIIKKILLSNSKFLIEK